MPSISNSQRSGSARAGRAEGVEAVDGDHLAADIGAQHGLGRPCDTAGTTGVEVMGACLRNAASSRSWRSRRDLAWAYDGRRRATRTVRRALSDAHERRPCGGARSGCSRCASSLRILGRWRRSQRSHERCRRRRGTTAAKRRRGARCLPKNETLFLAPGTPHRRVAAHEASFVLAADCALGRRSGRLCLGWRLRADTGRGAGRKMGRFESVSASRSSVRAIAPACPLAGARPCSRL